MTDLPRLPPGVLLSSSTRTKRGHFEVHILFRLRHGSWKVDETQTKRQSAKRIPLQTHLHTYRLWWRHLLHRYVWVSNGCGGGEGDWSGVTALPPRTVGKYGRCSEAQQFPSLAPLVQHVPLTRGGYKKPDPFISQYSPFHGRQFFPVTWRNDSVISLRLIVAAVRVSFSTGSAPDPLQYRFFVLTRQYSLQSP